MHWPQLSPKTLLKWCYWLNECLGPSKILVEILMPQRVGIKRRGLWGKQILRVKPSWVGWVSLQKHRKGFPQPFYHVRLQGEVGHLWTRNQAPTDIKFAGTLILDFLTSRSVRNKLLLFINHTVHDIFVTAAKGKQMKKIHKFTKTKWSSEKETFGALESRQTNDKWVGWPEQAESSSVSSRKM